MQILGESGKKGIATVYVARLDSGNLVECVESVQPPIPRDEKWVLIVSTLLGCPVKCQICDAGTKYAGKLSKKDMLDQIDFMVTKRFPDKIITIPKFKIQFARMGEPVFNLAVLDVLDELPEIYQAPGLLPSISTIAPDYKHTNDFFRRLFFIKEKNYRGNFQLQFSLHSTDEKQRNRLIPTKKLSFDQISAYGNLFKREGDKKIVLNFALADPSQIDPEVLYNYFDPKTFLVKITPVNPTYAAKINNISSYICTKTGQPKSERLSELENRLKCKGYTIILSVGDLEENLIGSNCGQYIQEHVRKKEKDGHAYSYVG